MHPSDAVRSTLYTSSRRRPSATRNLAFVGKSTFLHRTIRLKIAHTQLRGSLKRGLPERDAGFITLKNELDCSVLGSTV